MLSALEPRLKGLFAGVAKGFANGAQAAGRSGHQVSAMRAGLEDSRLCGTDDDPATSNLKHPMQRMYREVRKSVRGATEGYSEQECWNDYLKDTSKVKCEFSPSSVRISVTPSSTFLVKRSPELALRVPSCQEYTVEGDKVTIMGIWKDTSLDDNAEANVAGHWTWCTIEPPDDTEAPATTSARSRREKVIAGMGNTLRKMLCVT